MSRIAITLDEHALSELSKRAQTAQEPVARTAARLVRDGLLSTDRSAAREQSATSRQPERRSSETSNTPGWLEPEGERKRWRRELWASVCSLSERYPNVFSKLIADWWTDRAFVEILGALSTWRSQLDAGENPDPRAELLFHDRLELLERRLTTSGDPTVPRFTGGPPPSQ